MPIPSGIFSRLTKALIKLKIHPSPISTVHEINRAKHIMGKEK